MFGCVMSFLVDVVLLCFNEEWVIVDVLWCFFFGYCGIVVDNGLIDCLVELVVVVGVFVVSELWCGFGLVVYVGLFVVIVLLVVFCDVDGLMDLVELIVFVEFVESGIVDLVFGWCILMLWGVWLWYVCFVNWVFVWLMCVLMGVVFYDFGLFWIVWCEVFLGFDLWDWCSGYFLEMVLKVLDVGWSICE